MEYGFVEILQLIGGLGVFLFGMKQMSDALTELAGDRMRSILATMTSNRFRGLLTGFLIDQNCTLVYGHIPGQLLGCQKACPKKKTHGKTTGLQTA